MNNEEAIENLKEMEKEMRHGYGNAIVNITLEDICCAIEALEKQKDINQETESVSESEILQNCIYLMGELFTDFVEWYRFVHGDDAIEELDDEERFQLKVSYFHIVQRLFLWGSNHSGGTSTRQKCRELGIDDGTDTIEFAMVVE